MGTWRTYLAPIQADGTYSRYQEVTKYAIGNDVGKVKRETEKDDYDIGIAPKENISVTFDNSRGDFSEAGISNSRFNYRRDGSKIKLTYLFGEMPPICGSAICGEAVLGPEIDAFEGILAEEDAIQNVIENTISFTVRGKIAILESIESDISTITSDDTISSALYKLMNQDWITKLIYLDAANFNPTYNPQLKDINSDLTLEYLSNTTVKEAVDLLLEASASILYIEDYAAIVSDRNPNEGIKYYFYGQASNFGLENIQNISGYKTGINRTFNFWKWRDTNTFSKDTSSLTLYGVKKHDDIDFKAVNVSAAQQVLLNTYKTEFANPRTELLLTTPINVAILGLIFMDKVSIDYPNVPINTGAGSIPVWNTGTMIWRDQDTFDPSQSFFTWPEGLFNIEIEPNQEWKIMGIEIDSKTDLATFKLREVT